MVKRCYHCGYKLTNHETYSIFNTAIERSFVFVKIVILHIYECEQKKEKGLHLLEQAQP